MTVISPLSISRIPVLSFVVLGLVWGAFAASVPALKFDLGVNDAEFGGLLLCSAIGLLAATWLAPVLDRVFGRHALQIAVSALAVSAILPGLAAGPWPFGLAMLFLGMSSGLTDVVMNTRVAELEARHKRSLMNVNHAMFSLSYAFAAIAAGLGREMGVPPWQVFAVIAVLAVSMIPWMAGVFAEPADHRAENGAFPRRLVIFGGMLVLIAFMVENATEIWSALHIERTLGGRAAEGALGPALLGLTMGLGRLGGQYIAGRAAEAAVILWAGGLAALGMALAAAAPVPAVAYLGFGLAGLGVSVIAPMALALIGQGAVREMRAQAIARASVIGFMGFFIGPPLIGALSELTSLRVGLAAAAAALLLVPVFLGLMRRA